MTSPFAKCAEDLCLAHVIQAQLSELSSVYLHSHAIVADMVKCTADVLISKQYRPGNYKHITETLTKRLDSLREIQKGVLKMIDTNDKSELFKYVTGQVIEPYKKLVEDFTKNILQKQEEARNEREKSAKDALAAYLNRIPAISSEPEELEKILTSVMQRGTEHIIENDFKWLGELLDIWRDVLGLYDRYRFDFVMTKDAKARLSASINSEILKYKQKLQNGEASSGLKHDIVLLSIPFLEKVLVAVNKHAPLDARNKAQISASINKIKTTEPDPDAFFAESILLLTALNASRDTALIREAESVVREKIQPMFADDRNLPAVKHFMTLFGADGTMTQLWIPLLAKYSSDGQLIELSANMRKKRDARREKQTNAIRALLSNVSEVVTLTHTYLGTMEQPSIGEDAGDEDW